MKDEPKAEIVRVAAEVKARAEEIGTEDPRTPKIGRWYWVTGDKEKWFGCVVHVGSNYAEVKHPGGGSARIHEDDFYEVCELVPDPSSVIGKEIGEKQAEVAALMEEVRAITRRLAVPIGPNALPATSEAHALAVRKSDADMAKYKTALARAKEKELPDLFEKIKKANEGLGIWLKAELIPLKAQADAMRPAIEAIEDRIFSVELYAGLSESIAQIKDGDPAPMTEKVRLMQRRCYMDEECLARYEVGGMEFKDMRAFHDWLARRENMERILPFPKCVVAFRVRRDKKDRDWEGSLLKFFSILDEEKADMFTYLYIRNGEKLFCLATSIDFEDKLFPDVDHHLLKNDGRGKLYAKMFSDRVDEVISEAEYLELVREDEEAKKSDKHHWSYVRDYHPFERGDVHYDDIAKYIQGELKKHNRIVLVLQGLLDRSPVLHPHSPWQVWTAEGFEQGLELIYDDSRALTTGDKPDFEAYRARLNASLAEGSVTVGQDDFWAEKEADKESERCDRDWRYKSEYRPSRFRPHGNPGPGMVSRVAAFSKKGGCTFEWERERARWGDDGGPVRCSIKVPTERLLNASAYKPGDFRQFFDDPRTRAEYLKWAPFLLEAEEFQAGNREPQEPPKTPKKKPEPLRPRELEARRRRLGLRNKAVRLAREIRTKGDKVYAKGTLWRVVSWDKALFDIVGIDESGRKTDDERIVRCVTMHDLVIDETVPPDPKEDAK